MNADILLAVAAAALFAAVHLFAPTLYRLGHIPRAWWVSASGGVAVAYVFLHLLPDLAEHEHELAESDWAAGELVYVLALIGLAAFYALERHVRGGRPQDGSGAPHEGDGIFWAHLGSFATYNLLIGYLLLHREETSLGSETFYAVAMALHFVTTDIGLRHDHRHLYDRIGRWLLVGGVVGGLGLSLMVELPEQVIIALSAFLVGGVVLNVLKEELPEDRESRFLPFFAGAAGYGALLFAVL
ncbi:hypothetical protein OG2516_03248 [Oceanicola granulosus HTCC2516]|uniref:ZIP Zinc transporter n=1 Tax=Oceanicola granulosus (strain ATCC BAA-861 / DSM 15982 / KCTC 12143 / HTCC2516) TaxID=314256 RepID=Q2CE76_OCEGH|nr:hypothetical protein [Oceanicola granulosus]EAR50984.1 hypothetical protein OG2516_03248 [Oceanicola granulosus HTCC2516]